MNKKYPESLPGPSLSGFKLNQRDTVISTEFVTGRSRQRNTYSNVPPLFNARWHFSISETRIFEAWYRSIGNGSEWFDMPVKLPTGYSVRTVRFVGSYDGPAPWGSSNNWTVSATLELQDLPTFTGDDYLFDTLGIEYADAFDIAVNTGIES